ncbi:hypothetical protein [Arthrobacter sp. 35W]|uniref:hypothetical protein n=1 Tax=Arthrobacter sp. 35W TaxID=1132441 RepID=UPI00041CD9AF|nr:hypothetical protein [Arthrobacter sp. 35W]
MNNGARLIKIGAIWLLALMLAALAAVASVAMVNANFFGPQQPVRDYFAALHEGDGAKALGLLRANVPQANAAMLDGDGLKQSAAAVTDLHVGNPRQLPGGHSAITASYTIDGAELSTDFELEPGPRHWLFFDSWRFVPTTLPTIDVSVVNAQQAMVNSVKVNMPGGRNTFAVFFPGKYQAEYRSDFFQAPPVTRTVTASGTRAPAVALATGPTSALVSQVDAKLHQYLDQCAGQPVLLPTDCPLGSKTDNRVLSAVKWTILSYPEVDISAYGGTWVLAPLTVKAQVEFQEQELFTGKIVDVKTAEDFGFTAKLNVTDTSVSVTPVVSY